MNKKWIGLLSAFALAGMVQTVEAGPAPRVELTTSMGKVVLELNREQAPKTVDNFLQYVNNGHYTGTIFHRVIKGFMIQGGGFTASMSQKPTLDNIKNEANNGLKNARGTIAMARTSEPHSASAQFFINTVDNDFLNFRAENTQGWGYCVFGKVVEGMEVVDAIENQATGRRGPFDDVPRQDVVILGAREL